MNEQTNTYAFGFHEHALISKMVRRMKNMISPTHSSNSTDTPGCDDFIDYDPLAYYHNMMELDVDVDDNLDSEDLFINLDCLETSSETPASLTRDTSYTPGNASTVSNGSNDDVSNSIGPSNKPFPLLLHSIVSDEATDKAIHWLPCGKRFVVSDKEEFSQNVLPLYFGARGTGPTTTTKFTSFTRRLKRWNFSRVPAGKELGAYYHEYFQRGEPDLAKKIVYPMGKHPSPTPRGKPRSQKMSRRASTGSMPLPMSGPTRDRSISPAPLKKTFSDESADDMKVWLSNTDFESEGPSFPLSTDANRYTGNPCPEIHSPSAFSDSAFLHAPPLLPSFANSGCFEGEYAGSNAGRQMRRYSHLDPRPIQYMGNRHNATTKCSIDAYPDPVSIISLETETVVTEDALDMSFSPNDVFSFVDPLNILPSEYSTNSSIDDEDDFTDLLAKSLSYDGTAADSYA